VHYLMNKN